MVLLFSASLAAQKQPFDVQALLKIARIQEPQLSPDGKTVAFTVQTVDLAQNTKPKQIYTVPVNGGSPRQITTQGIDNERPEWSPDSKQIAFISDRAGSAQVWIMNADGSNARQITNLSTEAGGVLFSPDGKKLVFTSNVFPDCPDDACNKSRLDAEKNSKVKARSYTTLLYRHWTEWQTKRRSHLLVVDVAGGPAKDLTPGDRDVPPFSLGGPDDYAISADSKEVCYSMNADPVPATSTNSDLFVVPIIGGESVKITSNPGADSSPQYSPDGKWLAYRSQARAGYESDRWRLVVLDRATGRVNVLTDRWTAGWKASPGRPIPTPCSSPWRIAARQTIEMIPAAGGATRVVVSGASTLDDMKLTSDAKTMIYTGQSGSAPTEIYRASSERRRTRRAHAFERCAAGAKRADAAGGFLGGCRRQDAHPEFRGEAAELPAKSEIPGYVFDPRRPGRRLGRKLDLSLERAGVRLRRLCGDHAESARLHGLWPEVHRRHPGRLGRQAVRRHHGGGGSRG